MKKTLVLIFTLLGSQFSIAQVDSITDKQLISIFANLPLNETKEKWKTILEKQPQKYIDTPSNNNTKLFIIKDLSPYHTISRNISRGYIQLSGAPVTNDEKKVFDTSSVVDVYLYLMPGITKKEAKSTYTKFLKIVQRSFVYENNLKPKGSSLRFYSYSNFKTDRFKPLFVSLTQAGENGYVINLHYQKMQNGNFFIRKQL